MAARLVNLFVKNVSAVARPANRRRWLVVKSVSDKSVAKFEDYAMPYPAPADDDGPTTFAEALFDRRVWTIRSTIGEYYGALMETICGIREADADTVPDKPAAVKDAVKSFVATLTAALPTMLADLTKSDEELSKAERVISADRVALLKTAHCTLGDMLAEQEGLTMSNTETRTAPDANALTRMAHGIAALFGRATGADDVTIKELEKQAAGTQEPEIPAEVAARLAKSEADNAAMATRLAKAEQDAKTLRDEVELRKFADEVAGYKDLGLDPTKDAALLKSVSELLPKEQADRIREIFKSAVAQKAASNMFGEVGSSGAGDPLGTTAESKLVQLTTSEMAKAEHGGKLSKAEAQALVFQANPALYEQWRRETTVNAG